ncbi:mucin-5B-like, partial [Hyperolius riggenbachi]|uniref:mucin-5B-like n=1 Tax=Hyperolius riggenbachi TaxID=752182 RepID=UPI0035A32B38
VEGGAHFTTFDQWQYSAYGDCTYVIAKLCYEDGFAVLGDIGKCSLKENDVCLTKVVISANSKFEILMDGSVFINDMLANLPLKSELYTIFEASEKYYLLQLSNGPQILIQLKPVMQLYITVNPSYTNRMCGLCGNYNNIQADDFKSMSGVTEGTPAAFINTWKTRDTCPDVENVADDPCSLNAENEAYAKQWCLQIADENGPFSPCHSVVDPAIYKQNCIADTCRSMKSEASMCAAVFSYVKICAAKGIMLTNWQLSACSKPSIVCSTTQVLSYSITSCKPSCRSLAGYDVTCSIHFSPLPGCTCKKGFYLNDNNVCVPASTCPCYSNGLPLLNGQTVPQNGVLCTCTRGKLHCFSTGSKDCKSPMIFADCITTQTGTECAKSCRTLDMHCYSTGCTAGCLCPPGLVSFEKGKCIPEEQCPCIHNGAMYESGEVIQLKCNTCTCKNRKWECTTRACLAICTVYGNGHYITFDGKRYTFNGNCAYTVSQDYCTANDSSGTFRIITENIPCGNMGATCSKSMKLFLGDYELILDDSHVSLANKGSDTSVPYRVRLMGIYLVVEINVGIILIWDKRSSIFIKVTSDFKGRLCGLCGNYDGNTNNDFTTRNNAVVGNTEEFGNSWKILPGCPDAKVYRDACSLNAYRHGWAQRKCSIILSDVFATCHQYVDASMYYDACVSDSCACNTGGDCECLCTAVAAYAQACGEHNICVAWRTPSVCPLFCDYYNSKDENECEWHYRACGAPCMKTCRNPSGKCDYEIRGLEGCYPKCPENKPYFDEDEMKCVAVCGCYDKDRKHYHIGAIVPSEENCHFCNCTMEGIICIHALEECRCEYKGNIYRYNETIYTIDDGSGVCIKAICLENITIEHYLCPITTSPSVTTETTVKSFTTAKTATSAPTTISTKSSEPTTTPCKICTWTEWFDEHKPTFGYLRGGDFEYYDDLISAGKKICPKPEAIECRATDPKADITQVTTCKLPKGFSCYNKNQGKNGGLCLNYEYNVNNVNNLQNINSYCNCYQHYHISSINASLHHCLNN